MGPLRQALGLLDVLPGGFLIDFPHTIVTVIDRKSSHVARYLCSTFLTVGPWGTLRIKFYFRRYFQSSVCQKAHHPRHLYMMFLIWWIMLARIFTNCWFVKIQWNSQLSTMISKKMLGTLFKTVSGIGTLEQRAKRKEFKTIMEEYVPVLATTPSRHHVQFSSQSRHYAQFFHEHAIAHFLPQSHLHALFFVVTPWRPKR